jgi:hypothetical protein
MNTTAYILLVNVPLLILGSVAIAAVVWNRNGGTAAILGKGSPLDVRLFGMATGFALWLLLTVSTECLAFVSGLLVFSLLLYWLGEYVASAGAMLLVAVLVCIPFLWGWALLRQVVRH